MNTRLSKQQWQTLLDEQEQSGLSVVAFCRDHNLNAKSFYNQRSNMQKLYAVEKSCVGLNDEERYRMRQEKTKPLFDKLEKWLQKSLANTPPKTALGRALHYLDKQWPRLIGYLDDDVYPTDNNRAENAVRPFVIGRKNWLFANSQAGARASANLYSLIETAKANDLEPYAYLKHVFTELPKAETVEDIEALLPWHVKGVVG